MLKGFSKLKYWQKGLGLGIFTSLLVNLYFTLSFYFYFDIFPSGEKHWCGPGFSLHECSSVADFFEKVPPIFVSIPIDLLQHTFWLLVFLGIMGIPTLVGYLLDKRDSR